MLSVPTVAQMLTVIGAALLGVVVVTSAVSIVLDRLASRTAKGLNAQAAGTTPVRPQPSVPGQRTPSTTREPVASR